MREADAVSGCGKFCFRSGQDAVAGWQRIRKADINGRHDHGPAGHCAGQFDRGAC
jgi:hypothetical protein